MREMESNKLTFTAHILDIFDASFVFFLPHTVDSASLNVCIYLITYPGVPYGKYCWWSGR